MNGTAPPKTDTEPNGGRRPDVRPSGRHPKPDAPDKDLNERNRNGARLVYFAAERTLLSWVRAALGLMVFGFVVDRFGLFLYHSFPHRSMQFDPQITSLWMGTFLVVAGMCMSVAAAIRYIGFIRRYRRTADTDPGRGLSLAVVFTLLITAAVSGITVFLITMIR